MEVSYSCGHKQFLPDESREEMRIKGFIYEGETLTDSFYKPERYKMCEHDLSHEEIKNLIPEIKLHMQACMDFGLENYPDDLLLSLIELFGVGKEF